MNNLIRPLFNSNINILDTECNNNLNIVSLFLDNNFFNKDYCSSLITFHQNDLQEISLDEALNSSYNFILEIHQQDNCSIYDVDNLYDYYLTIIIKYYDENIGETFTEEISHKLTDLTNDEKSYLHKIFTNQQEIQRNKNGNYCTLCGKELDVWDKQENFGFNYQVGYGSKFDLSTINVKLCCKCFDKLMDNYILPKCTYNPVCETI